MRVEAIVARAFPPALEAQLRSRLAVAHAERPFSPLSPRESARRISAIAEDLQLRVVVYRGGLDIGGAELDHVWAVVDERVVDAAVPLYASRFIEALRVYVAGDLDDDELDRAAHPYSVQYRVVGEYPDAVRYVGAPVWGSVA